MKPLKTSSGPLGPLETPQTPLDPLGPLEVPYEYLSPKRTVPFCKVQESLQASGTHMLTPSLIQFKLSRFAQAQLVLRWRSFCKHR